MSKPLAIPAERPVATGELVAVTDTPAYRKKHGLRIVRGEWRPTDHWPRLVVEFVDPEKSGKEKSQ